MNWKNTGTALAMSVAAIWSAGTAQAADFCGYEGMTCSKASDFCLGTTCVPKDRLCKSDGDCKGWQRCDFTCPGGISVGNSGSGSTGSGGAPTPCSADGCGSEEMPKAADGGASDQARAPDAGGFQKDVSQPPPPPPCPKDQGVCVVDPKKVTAQPGCAEFCGAVLGCDFLDGAQSGGGSTDPGEPPPLPSEDGGSSGAMPQPIDAGSAEAQADTSGAKPGYPDAGAVPVQPDAGAGDASTSPEELAQCVLFCSVWKLENVAQAEYGQLAQCVASHKGDCAAMESGCKSFGESLGKAVEASDAWQIGLFAAIGGGSEGSGNSTDKAADATSGGSDSAGAPQQADGSLSSDTGATPPSAAGGGGNSSSGCTASSTATTSPWGLALLAFLGFGLLVRRRARA